MLEEYKTKHGKGAPTHDLAYSVMCHELVAKSKKHCEPATTKTLVDTLFQHQYVKDGLYTLLQETLCHFLDRWARWHLATSLSNHAVLSILSNSFQGVGVRTCKNLVVTTSYAGILFFCIKVGHENTISCTVGYIVAQTLLEYAVAHSINSVLCILWNQCNCLSFCATAYHEVVTTYIL